MFDKEVSKKGVLLDRVRQHAKILFKYPLFLGINVIFKKRVLMGVYLGKHIN